MIERGVSHEPGIFFIALDSGEKAFLRYSMDGNIMVLVSTFTPEKYRGLGLAEKITEKAIEYAKEKNFKIKPICSYAGPSSKNTLNTEDFLANILMITNYFSQQLGSFSFINLGVLASSAHE
ncbi:MAG: GNAT family N-acetyltransferase [Candidatus Bathyarchaeota archaeon]